jgi:myo-inositol-1(or 4)-monophosphatase
MSRCRLRVGRNPRGFIPGEVQNLLTIASGLCIGGIEATPKVWDIAATWVICQAAGATWYSLKQSPFPLQAGKQYHSASYPCLVLGNGDWKAQFLDLAGSNNDRPVTPV